MDKPSYGIKKLIIETHKADNCDLLLNLKVIDDYDREAYVVSENINIGDEIIASFGIENGFKLFKKDKYV